MDSLWLAELMELLSAVTNTERETQLGCKESLRGQKLSTGEETYSLSLSFLVF